MAVLELIKAIFLGIVEGITEWLPISSTGHMILVEEFINMNLSDEFMEMFRVVIQLGAIMAVVVLYWNKLFPFSFEDGIQIKKDTFSLWIKVLAATLPAALIGVPFDDKIDELFYNYITVAITLIVYGVLFIIMENRNKSKIPAISTFEELGYKAVLLIGAFQVLALIPGTSRSGATILGAIMIGCSREIAAEFSFYLAIPVMFGASLLKLVKFGFAFSQTELIILLTGMIVAFAVSIFAIKFLMGYIKRNDFKAFGYYRIILGLIVVLYFLAVR
ncbi:undecaprenyl-diphosphate phosphatase [Acetivibrio thermocellus]|uniref:undecaprenyl-diphosphate phosphatase n=1 Tax=Acetivibrio thermocellus TaxID=1515 RepID=UPI0018F66CC4|nr:undecaprenyl-diphosphate phosphatase [Acetivibrio thermocellus]UWV46885.1 undecaprenyl-diphosphate phosphatase [Acetivibrio thermocellus]HOP93391.1 undecaprenyl-diphosphate phosphatase [Acetivibrio thermocellus]